MGKFAPRYSCALFRWPLILIRINSMGLVKAYVLKTG
jgi:hypothetical protein